MVKPFEFGKSIRHSHSEVGSFLTPQPFKIATSWLKYIVIGAIILFMGPIIYTGINAFQGLSLSKPAFLESLFSPSMDAQIEQLKAEQTDALPKIEAAIRSNTLDGEWIVLDEIRFATGTARLMDARQLNGIAALLIRNPEVVIKVGGFTDDSGDADKNVQLSVQRAINVAQRLADLGVPTDNLYYEGFGATMPLCSETASEACKSINRRIAIQIQSK
jgi:outer membrane protein OmpA-like peptidoglycan-associated protein